MDSPGLLYAAVQFEGESRQAVRQVTITFESAEAADRFAVEHGYLDYTVAPLAFIGTRAETSSRRAGATHGRGHR